MHLIFLLSPELRTLATRSPHGSGDRKEWIYSFGMLPPASSFLGQVVLLQNKCESSLAELDTCFKVTKYQIHTLALSLTSWVIQVKFPNHSVSLKFSSVKSRKQYLSSLRVAVKIKQYTLYGVSYAVNTPQSLRLPVAFSFLK